MDEFATHSGIAWNGHVGTVQYGGGDRTMVVLFFLKPVPNPAKSRETGAPFYEDKTYVRIHPPGERLNIVERPATEQDKQRWPMQWAQFQQNKAQTADGVPIDLLYPDHPSVAATLRAHGVNTIEHCADLSGTAIDLIGMGAQRYCNDAKKYMEVVNKGVKASQMRAELEERDRKMASMEKKILMLEAELERQREQGATGVDLAQVQTLLAGLSGRPVVPQTRNVPKAFDVQEAQIAANHVTTDLTRQRKRPRARIQG